MVDIRLENVSFRYRRKHVLDDLTWTIRPGVTGLLGENGAGKTTLMSIMVGVRAAQAGTVAVGDSDDPPVVGFVPQRFSFPGELRLRDAVSYAAWLQNVPRSDTDAAATAALGEVDLADRADERVRKLSGGQHQRLGIAAALAHEPDVLILDEPTVGLDARQRRRVLDVITRITSVGSNRTVLISTHRLDDITAVCQRVGVLRDGAIAFDGNTDELRDVPQPASTGLAEVIAADSNALERGYLSILEGTEGERR